MQETAEAFYSSAGRVAEGLLEGVASYLGLPRKFFTPSFDPHTSYLRLNYYPPCPEPCGMLSVNRHSDAGALTVLLQESGTTALQVRLSLRMYLPGLLAYECTRIYPSVAIFVVVACREMNRLSCADGSVTGITLG